MPIKKATKKTTPTKKSLLSTWLFKQPLIFTAAYFIISTALIVLSSIINAVFNINSFSVLMSALFISFVFSAYYFLIKKLPHEEMRRDDLIAITNGCSLIAIVMPLIMLLFTGTNVNVIQHKIMWMYIMNPTVLLLIGILITLFLLYMSGVALSGIYAKYKRAVTMGISKWKVLCSIPFAFLLVWTPGYLIPEKNVKSNLTIKTKWYSIFNNWVISDITNTVLTFLVLLLLKNAFSGFPVLLLTFGLLAIYGIWYLKYKNNLTKIMNRGYALSAVCINITLILAMLIFSA